MVANVRAFNKSKRGRIASRIGKLKKANGSAGYAEAELISA